VKEPPVTTARWIVALCISLVVTFGGWSIAAAETTRNRELVKNLEKIDSFDYLAASHTAQLTMLRERLDELQDLMVENNRLLLQIAGVKR